VELELEQEQGGDTAKATTPAREAPARRGVGRSKSIDSDFTAPRGLGNFGQWSNPKPSVELEQDGDTAKATTPAREAPARRGVGRSKSIDSNFTANLAASRAPQGLGNFGQSSFGLFLDPDEISSSVNGEAEKDKELERRSPLTKNKSVALLKPATKDVGTNRARALKEKSFLEETEAAARVLQRRQDYSRAVLVAAQEIQKPSPKRKSKSKRSLMHDVAKFKEVFVED
jgi:hypothetical protein